MRKSVKGSVESRSHSAIHRSCLERRAKKCAKERNDKNVENSQPLFLIMRRGCACLPEERKNRFSLSDWLCV